MIRRVCCVILLVMTGMSLSARIFSSPNNKISIELVDKGFIVKYQKNTVLSIPFVGMNIEGQYLHRPKYLEDHKINERYVMLTGKRRYCSNKATEYIFAIADGQKMIVRLYNDGIAFRYICSNLHNAIVNNESTSFNIPEGQKRWIQQFDVSYERFYPLTVTGKSNSHHWGFPALIQPSHNTFVLLTEADIERHQSASSLLNDDKDNIYKVCPDKNDEHISGDWHSPWRVAMIGSLSDIVESTLVTDVSTPSRLTDTSWIKPGVVSWIYWAYNRGSKDYQIVKKYIDMAVQLHLPYVLIDWEWDVMANGGNIDDALAYAKERGIKVLVWYNSSTAWTTNGAGGPLFRLNAPVNREKEFEMLQRKGVAGVKIDFFEGDTQATMDYCIDLLESAARHHLLVNFHGATIPRGWQRTFPNLLSTEAVYGAEWYNNADVLTKAAARHNCTLPFTRNVIGPMDYTPCTFSDSQHPHITTKAHELALTVVFESALQHLADKPESYLAQPLKVQQYFTQLPSVWDETRLVNGYPGEYVVLARRKGNRWFVGMLNGDDKERLINVDLTFIKHQVAVTCYEDDGHDNWKIYTHKPIANNFSVNLQARGGSVMIIDCKDKK